MNNDYILRINNLEKTYKSENFGKKCKNNINLFYSTFLKDPDSICDMTYKNSWEFIGKGINSIERHTNLGILIKGIIGR